MRPSMLSRTLIVLALVGAVTLMPIGDRSGQAQAEQVYLALGDSIPAGLLASLPGERGYPALLHQLIESQRMAADEPANVELVNLAEPGETVESFQTEGQLESALEEIDAAPEGSIGTVTLTIGGNNILSLWEATAAEREEELELFETEFSAVVGTLSQALAGHDADVVVTTYYDLTEGDPDVEGSNAWWLRQFNDVISETATDVGFDVVDLESLFRGRVTELTWFPADIHPNNAGHQAIARTIWEQLSYDQDPPDIEITRPDEGEVRSRVPTVHAVVSDDVGIDEVTLEVPDADPIELLYVPDLEAWVGVWDAREFPHSEAELTVVATDVSGNESSESVSIRLPSTQS